MVQTRHQATAIDKLRPFVERNFAEFQGISLATSVADCAALMTVEDKFRASAFLGKPRRRLEVLRAAAPGFRQGIRLWLEGSNVQLLDAAEVDLRENPTALLAKLGEPDHKIDAYFGLLMIERSEYVYLRRGLAVFINPGTGAIFRLAAFSPTELSIYESKLRLDLQVKRLPLDNGGAFR